MQLSMRREKPKRIGVIASLLCFSFGTIGTAIAAPPSPVPTHGVSPTPGIPHNPSAAITPAVVHPPSTSAAPTGFASPPSGITFTCDTNFTTYGPPGLCAALNQIVPPLYSRTFSNANASVYILFDPSAGLANSTPGFFNLVSYATYQAALQSESTDAAKAFVPAQEPSIFGNGNDKVSINGPLARVLGITRSDDGGGTIGPIKYTTAEGNSCTTPGVDCYDGVIRVVTPA